MIQGNALAEGDWVVVEFEGQGRAKDCSDYNRRYCSAFVVASGCITQICEYLDIDLKRSMFGWVRFPSGRFVAT